MRVGIMLRSIDETGGIGVYTKNIVQELLKIDRTNEYILFYRDNKNIGRFSDYDNIKEIFVRAPSKLFWDQVAIPSTAKKENVALIFHPKFTLPLLTKCKSVMVVHGADWFIPPYDEVYNKLDVQYIKAIMPLYFKKADFVISVSDYSTSGFTETFPQYKNKIKTIYFGPNKVFRQISEETFLKAIKAKYNLPDKFILTVIRYDEGTKNKRKNFGKMLEAYSLCKKQTGIPHKFVVVGKNCHKYGETYNIRNLGIEQDVIFPGLVEQSDLPVFYNLADLYLYPTIIEAFPIPLTEAMSCGCPIVTSNSTGLKEIAGDAAVLVEPNNVSEIVDAINHLLTNETLRKQLIKNGLERSKLFSWEKCARETLAIFASVANHN